MRIPTRDKLAKMAGNDQELIRFLEGLGASGNSASIADGDYGDITVTGAAWEINPGSVGLTEVDGDVLSRQFHTGFQAISTVTGLQTALDGKSDTSHNHSYPTLNDLPTLGTAAAADVGDFAAASHGHTQAEVLNLVADLAGKQPVGSYATAAQGALADTAVQPAALAAKQDTLVSATNIKTINGATILGSGDLVVSGGGGGASPIMSWMI